MGAIAIVLGTLAVSVGGRCPSDRLMEQQILHQLAVLGPVDLLPSATQHYISNWCNVLPNCQRSAISLNVIPAFTGPQWLDTWCKSLVPESNDASSEWGLNNSGLDQEYIKAISKSVCDKLSWNCR